MYGGLLSFCSTPLMKSLHFGRSRVLPLGEKLTWTESPVQFWIPLGSLGFGIVPATTGVPASGLGDEEAPASATGVSADTTSARSAANNATLTARYRLCMSVAPSLRAVAGAASDPRHNGPVKRRRIVRADG